MKILIADDNTHNLYLLEQQLAVHGHEVTTARNGLEALARLRAERFDACISDILMPGMDGFQFCRTVKADPALAAVPVIFYTATYTEPADVALGRQLGAAHYIIKPADAEVILGALHDLDGSAPPAPPPPLADDDYLAQYSARLIGKLESKMVDLERTNGALLKTNLALSDEIGRRRAAEKQARSVLEVQRATLESTLDGIVAVDHEGSLVAVNGRFSELWRLPPAEALPRTFGELVRRLCPLAADPAACSLTWHSDKSLAVAEPAVTLVLADGRVLERSARPMHLPDGGTGRVWTFRDVTEMRQAEEARRSLQAQLFELQKMEALGVLAGGIAHDFNNILTIILGQVAIAESILGERNAAQEPLANIAKASGRAADLVRQILAFSRREEPAREPVSAREAVEDTINLMRAALPAGVRIAREFADDLPLVRADRTQLHQVLMNLANNADHAMGGRGTLTFVLRSAVSPGDGPPELRPGRYLYLGVRDTGPGIDEAVQRRLFEPFFTTKPAGRGTGLGLAVVHGIIQSYGGHIRVRSRVGEGAEFQIYLPAAVEKPAEPAAPAAAGLRPGGGETVMVVEDDAGVREFIVTLLARLNYRTVPCDSAEVALIKFNERPNAYDLVITDLSMGGMSGRHMALQMRRLRPTVPVIIMTGYYSTTEFERDQASLQFDLLLKPTSAEALSESIFRVLNLHR